MPRQNRVTPLGDLIATSARGTTMGNRGCLHDAQGRIKRMYQGKRWIICRLEFKGRRRAIMTPGRYTELFFLDEATALAAGHRPCAECSRARFNEFVLRWGQAKPDLVMGSKISVNTVDGILHRERVAAKQKVTYSASISELPNGCFITVTDQPQPYMVFKDRLLSWYPDGYGQPMAHPNDQMVHVLTPRSVVAALVQGYKPDFHPSAFASSSKAEVFSPVVGQ